MSYPIPKIQWKNTTATGTTLLGSNSITGISDTSSLEVGMIVTTTPATRASYLDTPPGALNPVEITADNLGAIGNNIQIIGDVPTTNLEGSYNDTGNDDTPFGIYNTRSVAYVFQAPSNFDISRVEVFLRRESGAPGSNVTVHIQPAEQSGFLRPQGAIIATSGDTLDTTSISDSVMNGFDFDFPPGVSLVSGTYYSIVVNSDGAPTAVRVALGSNNTPLIAKTRGADPNNDLSNQANWTRFDIWNPRFKIYSGVGGAAKTIDDLISDWNVSNSSNTATVIQGGSEIINDGEIVTLSGGQNESAGGFPAETSITVVDQNEITLSNNCETTGSVTIEFKFEFEFQTPSIVDNGEIVKPKRRVKTSISGIDQVSIDHIRFERELEFGHLTENEIETLRDDFFKNHAMKGDPFRYFVDQTLSNYIEYELADPDFSPERLGNSNKFGFSTKFKRVES